MSPFHARTARPISTKFCTDLPTNSGKVLNTSMIQPTQPLDPRLPQTLKPKWVTGEKTLCNVKSPDGWRKLIKFFPGSAGARLASGTIIEWHKDFSFVQHSPLYVLSKPKINNEIKTTSLGSHLSSISFDWTFWNHFSHTWPFVHRRKANHCLNAKIKIEIMVH